MYLLQRKGGKLGMTLGKTTGWIHRSVMKKRHVEELAGCKYLQVSDEGLLIEQVRAFLVCYACVGVCVRAIYAKIKYASAV